jgi:hypothetical protein
MSKGDSCLALGCDDGILRIFSLSDEDYFISCTFPKQNSKLLSVLIVQSFYFAGTETGSILKFNEKGQTLQRMQADSAVWTLNFISDFLVSGEGSGMLSFWQHSRGVLKQQHKTHEADILTTWVQGDEVFASGVDSKVVRCKMAGNDWVVNGRAKGQSHDVRSLAWFQGNLLSGGVTSDICVYDQESFLSPGSYSVSAKGVGKFKKHLFRHVATLPFRPVCIPAKGFLLEGKSHSIELWNVESSVKSVNKVLSVNCKGNAGILSFGIHPSVKFLAYSNVLATRFLRLDTEDFRAEFINEKFRPCSVMQFSEDHLYCGYFDYFLISLKTFEVSIISRLDSLSVNLSVSGNLSALQLRNNKILLFKKNILCFSLPANARAITALGIVNNSVFFATDDNRFTGFNYKNFELEGFTSRFSNQIPKNYLNDVNRIIGILPFDRHKVLLYTHYSFTVVDLRKKPPKKCEILTKERFPEHKHTWAGILSLHSLHSENVRLGEQVDSDLDNFAINKRFGPVLAFQRNGESFVVAELDWEKALDVKPKPLAVHKYGK